MCYFLLSVLAVWRITHLTTSEDGPFDVVFLLRKKAGSSFWGKLMDCFYCASIWIALPFGCWLGAGWWERLLYWLALSGAACLLERATGKPDVPFYKED
ncbi:hypothetical protein LQ567_13540 [Niabella pedocola]|uniref:DUF1360 domain-containing protein n=1 Tax=Niabella pedocola TaxID=1752077 RepID=A0ABS8PRV0_9BACT|nr:hypothetical protein [Niabella pedocola]MCD2423793.1 hypothetical protein [Niabella pedocola]